MSHLTGESCAPTPEFQFTQVHRKHMATLTLKKTKLSQPLAPKPTYSIAGQFAVMRHARHEHSLRFSHLHQDHASAVAEAKRLAASAPTERFLVLFVMDAFEQVPF